MKPPIRINKSRHDWPHSSNISNLRWRRTRFDCSLSITPTGETPVDGIVPNDFSSWPSNLQWHTDIGITKRCHHQRSWGYAIDTMLPLIEILGELDSKGS